MWRHFLSLLLPLVGLKPEHFTSKVKVNNQELFVRYRFFCKIQMFISQQRMTDEALENKCQCGNIRHMRYLYTSQ